MDQSGKQSCRPARPLAGSLASSRDWATIAVLFRAFAKSLLPWQGEKVAGRPDEGDSCDSAGQKFFTALPRRARRSAAVSLRLGFFISSLQGLQDRDHFSSQY